MFNIFIFVFLSSLVLIDGHANAQSFSGNLVNVGWQTSSTKFDEPDFIKTKLGNEFRILYNKYDYFITHPESNLPPEFDPIIRSIYLFIQDQSVQSISEKSSIYYVGVNGSKNSPGFNFDKKNLPTKITRLSFCFGLDPFAYAGLIAQESKFAQNISNGGGSGASGFSQLTEDAIMEVSEQLGILGSGQHGKDAPLVFSQYIQCYLGSKKWFNIWEDGTIPAGSAAYYRNRNGSIREPRVWKYLAKTKEWLNSDPDRNLIYGAILFKLYLGQLGNYPKALGRYNVSHPGTYESRVMKYHAQLAQNYSEIKNSNGLWLNPEINKLMDRMNFPGPELKCTFPENKTVIDEINAGFDNRGSKSDVALMKNFEINWINKGYCIYTK